MVIIFTLIVRKAHFLSTHIKLNKELLSGMFFFFFFCTLNTLFINHEIYITLFSVQEALAEW